MSTENHNISTSARTGPLGVVVLTQIEGSDTDVTQIEKAICVTLTPTVI